LPQSRSHTEINANRLGDVLQLGLTKVADCEVKPRFHLPEGILRKTYSSGLSDAFQSRRDIDAVTHQVAIAFLDHVTKMNADAKFNPPLWRQASVTFDH